MLKIKNRLNKNKNVYKINKLFFKNTNFIKYLKKLGYNTQKTIQIYNSKIFSFKLKNKLKLIWRNFYLKKKKKHFVKTVKRFYKKWWFFKKKIKITAGVLENSNVWIGSFFYLYRFLNYKFNKYAKLHKNNVFYTYDHYYEHLENKKDKIKEIKFLEDKNDELYNYKLDMFLINLQINFNTDTNFFIMKKYDNFKNNYYYEVLTNVCINTINNKKSNSYINIKKQNKIKNIYKINYKLNVWL